MQTGTKAENDRKKMRTPIPATEVVRILQRAAEGDAKTTVIEADVLIELEIDGWWIEIADDAGQLDGVYRCKSPEGVLGQLEDWSDETNPTDLLSEKHEKALWMIIREPERQRRDAWLEEQRRIKSMVFGEG